MVAIVVWMLLFHAVVGQVFMPWDNVVVPDDPNDEDDRKATFDCYGECFGLTSSDFSKKPLAKVQPHCYNKVKDMFVLKLGDTKMYISGKRQINWFSAYAACRKNSLDLLGQGLVNWEEELANKLIKYFSDHDVFWLGGSNMVDNKFRWSDTGSDIAPTGRAAKLVTTGPGPHCLEARVYNATVTWTGVPCTEAKFFICVLQKPCLLSS